MTVDRKLRQPRTQYQSLDPVRQRPGMYIGGTGQAGITSLLLELVGNSIDEYLARRATKVSVSVDKHGAITVQDDGSGLPIAKGRRARPRALIEIFCRMHFRATLDGHHPHVHLRDEAVGDGGAIACALSSRFEIETYRDGFGWTAVLARGEVVEPLSCTGPSTKKGTRITFTPDSTVFGELRLRPKHLRAALTRLGYLCPTLDLRVQRQSLRHANGLVDLLENLHPDVLPLTTLHHAATHEGVEVDVALGWSPTARAPSVTSHVNYRQTRERGTHVEGCIEGFLASAPTNELAMAALPGLAVVVHVGMLDPMFGGPTKELLSSPQAKAPVRRLVSDLLRDAGWWWDTVIDHLKPPEPTPTRKKKATSR